VLTIIQTTGEITVNFETDWLDSRSRITPFHPAVIYADTGDSWNYEQMNQRAIRLASYLHGQGINKGDRVAILSPNHISYLDLLFACGKIGAIFVPLNWRLSQLELSLLIRDCSPKLLAVHSQMKILIHNLPVSELIQIDGKEYHQIVEAASGLLLPDVQVNMEDPICIIYTGGTTGKPKGAVLTHRSLNWNSINTIISWNLTLTDVTLTLLPMFHTGGLNALTFPILHVGGTVVLASDFHPDETMQRLQQYGCTIVLMVPTMYHMMIQSEGFKQIHFPTNPVFLSGGAPCPHSIYDAFAEKGLTFKEGYGLTEAGPNNFYIEPKMTQSKRGSVGKPMMYNRIKLVSSEGSEASIGEVGEITIQGRHLFDHYWCNEEATREAIVNGWLHTGDLGKKDAEGYYYIVGRKKEMIITGGENVYPLEVEHWIDEHPAVSEVAVVGLVDEKWGEIVTAFVVLHAGSDTTSEDLEVHCLAKLGKYKVPKQIVIVPELPKTAVGKIDKKEMVRRFA
jgi:fatty-acyl-CoA synthase